MSNGWLGRSMAALVGVFGVAAAFACGDGGNTGDLTPATNVGSSSQALWGCDTNGTRVVCTAALAAPPSVKAAYACAPSDTAPTCPDGLALRNAPNVKQLLASATAAEAFAKMPWACLVTGKQQFQCVRDLAALLGGGAGGTTDGAGSGAGSGTGSGAGSGAGSGSGSASGKPAIPSTCEPHAWEPYFAQLATYEYNAHGVGVTFPASIFDASAQMTDLAVAAGSVKSTPGAPSCHDGEWAMREQSWLDAVTQGCQSLSEAITVMCQQAANYAPNTGACNGTGTW